VMAIVGAQETASNSLSVRTRAEGDLGMMPVTTVMARLVQAVQTYGDF